MSLESKVMAMAAVIKEDDEYQGVADSYEKLDDYKIYAKNFNEAATDYFNSEKGLEYLNYHNIPLQNIDGLGSIEMQDGIVAAVIHYENGKKYMVSNGDFTKRVNELANNYHVPYEFAEKFVLDHEATHLQCSEEIGTAEMQKEFYILKLREAFADGDSKAMQEYSTLASMADAYIQQQEMKDAA